MPQLIGPSLFKDLLDFCPKAFGQIVVGQCLRVAKTRVLKFIGRSVARVVRPARPAAMTALTPLRRAAPLAPAEVRAQPPAPTGLRRGQASCWPWWPRPVALA